jgi:hypothetical protein
MKDWGEWPPSVESSLGLLGSITFQVSMLNFKGVRAKIGFTATARLESPCNQNDDYPQYMWMV